MINYSKYHGLGNDYIVIRPVDDTYKLTADQIRIICHRNYGPGSDGILLGPFDTNEADFSLFIFNPDGSNAEKSGNGLRIFSRYLYDHGLVGEEPFTVLTPGGKVKSQVFDNGSQVSVEMGNVSFDSELIPVTGPRREVIDEQMVIDGKTLHYCAATIGNPHCVVLCDEVSPDLAKKWGPYIENEPRFPYRTNVQFLKVLDRNNIRIEIWERGANYTLASGSSSCAAAAVAHRMGWCDKHITAHMPGGKLDITIGDNYAMFMTGPVVHVCDGTISEEAFSVML